MAEHLSNDGNYISIRFAAHWKSDTECCSVHEKSDLSINLFKVTFCLLCQCLEEHCSNEEALQNS